MAVAVALGAAAQPALAACGGAPIITNTSLDTGEASYVWSAGSIFQGNFPGTLPGDCGGYACYGPPLADNFTGVFWRLGTGNPAIGPGYDNGTYSPTGGAAPWIQRPSYADAGTYWYPAKVEGSWNLASDGCLDGGSGGFDPSDCMCMLLTDQWNGVGYFALLGDQPDGIGNSSFYQPGGAPLVLAPIPKVEILNSVRGPGPNFDVSLDLRVSAPGAGVYDECGCGPVSYRLHQRVAPRGTPTGDERALGQWAQVAGPLPIGTQINGHQVACGGADTDVHLTASLIFDSGFSTTIVSGNSTRVECGPNIATPEELHRPVRLPSRTPAPKKGGAR
jgi:hypothetical protein